jgi:glycosyltransferase involved in cell wall biosynthesis
MRIALFARVNTDLNPYILLYKQALERQGLAVHLEHEFSLKWLMARGKSCDAIHLHWIEAAYKPSYENGGPGLAGKRLHNRFSRALLGTLRLANFSAALLLAKLRGKTIVYTAHNLTYSGQFRPFVVLNRVAHRVVVSLSDHIHAHNHYTREILAASYNREDRVTVVPHGNYIGCYPNQIPRSEARRQLGLPDDAIVYLFLGLLRPYKGVEGLIEAFDKLRSSMGRLLIVGRVSSASYKERILSLSQGNPAIQLIPEFVPDEAIQLYMNACDACVLPYRNMTTSGAALLALSFGRPVIVPAIASFPELITPQTGILYDPSQPGTLVLALRQAGRRSWSEVEILDYVHQFDWDKLGPRLAALYQSTDNDD